MAIHVQCGSARCLTTISASGSTKTSAWDCLPQLKREVDFLICGGEPLVLTGVGGARAPEVMKVASLFPRRSRFYDVQDDLSYGARGISFLKFLLRDNAWRLVCPNRLALEAGMCRYYRNSTFLDNASDVERVERAFPCSSLTPLVYVGSIDERVDVSLLRRLLDIRPIDVWGRVHATGSAVHGQIERLASETGRLRLLGAYDNDQLGEILSDYEIGIVPYKADHRLTRHINPDKIYHYLNAGLGVLCSAFPQARRMEAFVTLIGPGSELSRDLQRASRQKAEGAWRVSDYRWGRRWAQLREAVVLG